MDKKILTVVGARPQFIKAAVVSRAVSRFNALGKGPRLVESIIHTGQHYDVCMSDVFFSELEIPAPHHHLGCGGGSHGAMTGKMLEKIEEILIKEKPDWVLVYGDTNSTLAGALAAVKLHIPVAHVEAGLRSFNRKMPEEINRILADQCADLLFTPTKQATEHLLREGIPAQRVHQVGDVMYDAALYYREKAKQQVNILDVLELNPKEYVLATVHRAENTDDPKRLRNIFDGLSAIARTMSVVIPLHPRTRAALDKIGLLWTLEQRLKLISPVGYLEMINLEAHARVVITDSGGVQKESYFYSVPCLVLRDETEWVELVEKGHCHIVGTNSRKIMETFEKVKSDFVARKGLDLYGQGCAADKIIEELAKK